MENDELTKAGYQKLRDFFRQLVEMGVTSVTVALPSVMEIARYAAPKLNIKASTVCQINSPMKAEFYENLGIRRLVLDEDIYRRFDVLKSIRQVFTGDLEVIVNSFCVMDCPYKMFHYNSLSFSHLEKEMGAYYSPRCRSQHMGVDSFLKLAWIRPEDLHYYEDIGIQYFKIQGRTNVYYGNPVKALEYYMKESYDGDLVKLLELFSEKRLLNIADLEVDNRKLEGFFGKFVHSPESCKKLCSECGYCRSFAESAISPTDRMLVGMMQAMGGCILENFPVSLE